MTRGVRYRVAKLGKWIQRVTVQVGFGCTLIVASHWWPDPGEREWMRDVGALVVGFVLARWTRQQGKRRRNRTPTLRMRPNEVDRIESHLERRDEKGD